jgi:Spy/CpxP family protein refolding chaperone
MTFRSILPRATKAAFAAAMLLVVPVTAQAQQSDADEIKAVVEAARAEMRASREALIAANLEMTTEQADRFWPVYREYNTEKAKLGDERLRIIMDYAKAYPEVDDATAKALVDRSVKYSKAMNSLKVKYVGKFAKTLPSAKLMRFLQIDSRIDNLVELQIQRSIPLAEPATK